MTNRWIRLIAYLLLMKLCFTFAIGFAVAKDNVFLAALKDYRSGNVSIYQIEQDGTSKRIRTIKPYIGPSTYGKGDSGVLLSRDSLKAAYIKNRNIWITNVYDSEEKRLTKIGRERTRNYSAINVLLSDISPDGEHILFYVTEEMESPDADGPALKRPGAPYKFNILNIERETTHQIRLDGDYLGWHPSGSLIFHSHDFDYNMHLVRVDPFTKNITPITSDRIQQFHGVDISPDGQWLLAATMRWVDNKPVSQIQRIHWNSKAVSYITKSGDAYEYSMPKFSPDGKHISYIKRDIISGKQATANLIVDGQVLYEESGHLSYRWMNQSSILLGSGNNLQIIDTRNGEIRPVILN